MTRPRQFLIGDFVSRIFVTTVEIGEIVVQRTNEIAAVNLLVCWSQLRLLAGRSLTSSFVMRISHSDNSRAWWAGGN